MEFGRPENKEKTFQGQRFDSELDLNWVQFKWRNHDPQIGRFVEIDPLSEKYVYISCYTFSENKVTNDVELEGLESVSLTKPSTWLTIENIKSANDLIMNVVTLKVMPIEGEVSGANTLKAEVRSTIKTDVRNVVRSSELETSTATSVVNTTLKGGRKGDLPTATAIDRHEIPSAKAMKDALGVNTNDVPAVQLPTLIHARTATFGFRPGATAARAAETALIKNGHIQQAFSNGVNDVKAIINSPQGEAVLKAAGYTVKDVNNALKMMEKYFKKANF